MGKQDENLWKVSQVAEFLGCSESLVYKLAANGELPKVRIGKAGVRFRPVDVRRYARGGDAPVVNLVQR